MEDDQQTKKMTQLALRLYQPKMPLSAAERMRRYREKIKSDPAKHLNYLQREKERYKHRKATGKLNLIKDIENEREKRNIRRNWRVSKAQQRMRKVVSSVVASNTPPASPELQNNENDANNRTTAGRKRVRRDRSKAYRRIGKLEKELKEKNTVIERYRKQSYRLRVSAMKDSGSPRTKTTFMLRGQRVDSSVKKTLLFHNALVKGIRESYVSAKNHKTKQSICKVLKDRLLKKYRLLNTASTTIGIPRKVLCKKQSCKPVHNERFAQVKRQVAAFYIRDDVSRVKAGKKETVTRNKIKKQKRLLNDSMKNLHLKFLSEYSNTKPISYSLFCRLRPFWVLIPGLTDRDTCQCRVHANAQFLADRLNQLNVSPCADVEKLIEQTHCDVNSKACMYGECTECKTRRFPSLAYNPGQQTWWYQWTNRVEDLPTTGKSDTEVKQVKKTVKEKVFGTVEHLRDDFQDQRDRLSRHIFNIRNQYRMLRHLTENLSEDIAVIHMDFSENYSCKFSSEIQSVHFGGSHEQASLHTGVIYTLSNTTSFCTFSDNRRHDPAAIWAHIDPVIRYLKHEHPNVKAIHFVSDGPTTQYRCRKNFYFFCTAIFGYGFSLATWNFLESGHGKGPADGVGAVVKRTADRLVSQGEDIRDAQSLFDTVSKSSVDVKMWLVSSRDIDQFDQKCPKEISAVPGTMKLHQVITYSFGEILHRCVSCFCEGGNQTCKCFGLSTCTLEQPQITSDAHVDDARVSIKDNPISDLDPNCLSDDLVGSWCVVEYDGLPYPGIIQAIDEEDLEVKVMHRIGNNRFFWPIIEDVVWYIPSKIVTLMPPTEHVTGRHQQIRPDIWAAILKKMDI